jgi:predicted aminopeptidase
MLKGGNLSYPMKALLFLLFLILILQMGCSQAIYISKLGWHQAGIALSSIPIQEVLKDERVDAETKDKIQLIQEVKHYGEEKLGLRKTKSYLKFFEVKGPILYVLTASEKDQFKLYNWNFPLIGKVTYKGFFSRENGLKEKGCLDGRGYDTYLQPALAYSTLGWLNDPIFSSVLKGDEATLVNLILHEMVHATVYFKGKTDFNEQMATFIGNQGTINFLAEKYGSESKEVLEAVQIQEDDLLFLRWIDQAFERLSEFYCQAISRDEKLKGREAIFLSLQEEFREMKPRFKTDAYQNFDQISLNNAVLLAYRQYFHRLETFERLYDYLHRDLRRVMVLMKEIRASKKEPSAYLDHWMKERGLTVSSSLQ